MLFVPYLFLDYEKPRTVCSYGTTNHGVGSFSETDRPSPTQNLNPKPEIYTPLHPWTLSTLCKPLVKTISDKTKKAHAKAYQSSYKSLSVLNKRHETLTKSVNKKRHKKNSVAQDPTKPLQSPIVFKTLIKPHRGFRK